MQKDPNNSNNGGSGNSANPPKKEAKKASEVVIELQQAKTELYNLVRRLPKPKNDNIIKNLLKIPFYFNISSANLKIKLKHFILYHKSGHLVLFLNSFF